MFTSGTHLSSHTTSLPKNPPYLTYFISNYFTQKAQYRLILCTVTSGLLRGRDHIRHSSPQGNFNTSTLQINLCLTRQNIYIDNIVQNVFLPHSTARLFLSASLIRYGSRAVLLSQRQVLKNTVCFTNRRLASEYLEDVCLI